MGEIEVQPNRDAAASLCELPGHFGPLRSGRHRGNRGQPPGVDKAENASRDRLVHREIVGAQGEHFSPLGFHVVFLGRADPFADDE